MPFFKKPFLFVSLSWFNETNKKGFLKKGNVDEAIQKISKSIDKTQTSCVICDKINDTMARYVDVLLYMWANDEVFKEKFESSKGVCLKHFKMLVDGATTSLKGDNVKTFLNTLIKKEKQSDYHYLDILGNYNYNT